MKQLLQLLLDFHMLGFLLKGVPDLLRDKFELGKAHPLKSTKKYKKEREKRQSKLKRHF